MNKEDELTIELTKKKAEEMVIKKELETAKQSFIKDLENGVGDELRNDLNYINKPIKLKKPFKLRMKLFFYKLNKVLGNN